MDDAVRDSFVEFTSQRMAESESFWDAVGSLQGLPSVAKDIASFGKDVSKAVAGGIDEEKALQGLYFAVDEVSEFMSGDKTQLLIEGDKA